MKNYANLLIIGLLVLGGALSASGQTLTVFNNTNCDYDVTLMKDSDCTGPVDELLTQAVGNNGSTDFVGSGTNEWNGARLNLYPAQGVGNICSLPTIETLSGACGGSAITIEWISPGEVELNP